MWMIISGATTALWTVHVKCLVMHTCRFAVSCIFFSRFDVMMVITTLVIEFSLRLCELSYSFLRMLWLAIAFPFCIFFFFFSVSCLIFWLGGGTNSIWEKNEFLFGVYYSKKTGKKEINFQISVFDYKQEEDWPHSSWNKMCNWYSQHQRAWFLNVLYSSL